MKYAGLVFILAIACASATKGARSDGSEVDPNAGEGLPPSEGPAEQCLDSENQPVQCNSDQDCCPGFYCGKDPQGSTRIMTCIYGGGAK